MFVFLQSTFEYPIEIADTDEMVTIKAFMTPLELSTMTKDMNSVSDKIFLTVRDFADSFRKP